MGRKLTASDGAASDFFGDSAAISGDTLVVGAAYADVSGRVTQGAAYVFARNGGDADNWGQVRKLAAADGAVNDLFGISAAFSGDTLVVGALNAEIGGNSSQGGHRLGDLLGWAGGLRSDRGGGGLSTGGDRA